MDPNKVYNKESNEIDFSRTFATLASSFILSGLINQTEDRKL